MIDSKLIDRQKKYNERLNSTQEHDFLIRRREEVNLNLRKNKLYDTLMEKRLKTLNQNLNQQLSDSEKNSILEIKLNKLDLPKSLIKNYETHSDKLIVISNLLGEKINKDIIYSEDYKKFALFNLRKYLSDKTELLSSNELNMLMLSIYPVLEQIMLAKIITVNENEILDQLILKYEVTWSLINLTSETTFFVNKLLDVSMLLNMEETIDDCLNILHKYKNKFNTIPLIRHLIWLFNNLLGENQESNVIVRNTVKIVDRLNHLLSNDFTYEFIFNSRNKTESSKLILVVLWAIQNFMRHTSNIIKHTYSSLLISVINILRIYSIEINNLEVTRECIETLTFFCSNSDLIKIFLENKIIPILLNALNLVSVNENFDNVHSDIKNIVKIIAELLVGSDEDIEFIMTYPVFDTYSEMLYTINSRNTTMRVENDEFYETDGPIVKSICMGLSNLCASTQTLIQKVILNQNLIGNILSLYDKFDSKVRYEILYIFFNAFYVGSNYIKAEIIRLNIHKIFIGSLNQTLEGENPSKALIILSLRAFLIFLDYGESSNSRINVVKIDIENDGIVNILEKLQFDKDMEIYDLAHEILFKYWGDNEFYYDNYSDLI